ncbi:MAG: phosphate/phosphite/phosphonate ABC transporter substrate-binding protein [Ignavibacteriales bacterium]|nr:putative phosphite transport system-binding protein PtxB [Ignavibacteriaceae bacterium]MCK6614532.1 phosphate/phosphite/phosphonate ABC transporter substrate-binding protein [Ignavibacteriaceae bacterium]QOJ29735.1 MAG: phosphate/phosphite/phosphonate ABC transporter substrate-binding protein [Ignavibacteriales bacterium]
MKLLKYILLSAPFLIFVIVTTVKEIERKELGSVSNPIKIYFTPSVDSKKITSNARTLLEFLEKETGYHFVTAVPSSFVAVVEAFGSKKADIASINTFSYLMANERYGAEAALRIVRDNGEISYRGQIVVRTDSGIDSIQQLNGKTIAYTDAASTSGYILPKSLLDKNNIKPSESVFAIKHDNVITMVYQRQVDAGATYYAPPDPATGAILDARMRVLTQFPDVGDVVKIIALTDEIPNDPIVFRKDLPEVMKIKVKAALLKFVSTPEGQHALYEIYDVRGFIETNDSDYDVLRNMLKNLGVSLQGLVKK